MSNFVRIKKLRACEAHWLCEKTNNKIIVINKDENEEKKCFET